MVKFHVNPETGLANECRARFKPCRFGAEKHYNTFKDAVNAAEEMILAEQENYANAKIPPLRKTEHSYKILEKQPNYNYDERIEKILEGAVQTRDVFHNKEYLLSRTNNVSTLETFYIADPESREIIAENINISPAIMLTIATSDDLILKSKLINNSILGDHPHIEEVLSKDEEELVRSLLIESTHNYEILSKLSSNDNSEYVKKLANNRIKELGL